MKPDSDHQFPLSAAYSFAVANVLIIGFSFSFVKVAVTLAGPVDMLAFRFIIALAVCVLYAKIKGIRPRFDWKNSLQLLPMGACYPLGFFLFQGFGPLCASSDRVLALENKRESGRYDRVNPSKEGIAVSRSVDSRTSMRPMFSHGTRPLPFPFCYSYKNNLLAVPPAGLGRVTSRTGLHVGRLNVIFRGAERIRMWGIA